MRVRTACVARIAPIADDRIMTLITDHDDYIAAAPEPFRPLLTHIRRLLVEALPDLEEVIRYDMPGFASGPSIVAGYAAFSKQCGLYVNKMAIGEYAHDIQAAGLKSTKTGVTFSPAKPIPDDLVRSLARASRKALGV